MTKYYSTFITGTQEIVSNELVKRLKNPKIDLLLDGLIVYECQDGIDKIKNLRFLNNSFEVIYLSEGNFTAKDLVEEILSHSDLLQNPSLEGLRNPKSFRVIVSQENQIVSIDNQKLVRVENLLAKKLKLEVNRALPDIEVWFLSRSEGHSLVGLRITKTPNYEKTLHKGELRPELANLMCLVAELKPTDIVLDPFAGYGAIPFECTNSFDVKKIYAGEKDKGVFNILQEKSKKLKSGVVVGRWDSLKLSALSDGFVDKIITDPPWGFYDKQEKDLKKFYMDMLTEFSRVLKLDGTVVLLTAQKEMFEELLKETGYFMLEKKYDVLVSGKKASIYKIVRSK